MVILHGIKGHGKNLEIPKIFPHLFYDCVTEELNTISFQIVFFPPTSSKINYTHIFFLIGFQYFRDCGLSTPCNFLKLKLTRIISEE